MSDGTSDHPSGQATSAANCGNGCENDRPLAAKVEADRQAILDAKAKGPCSTIRTYLGLSGPGWLQSALTLGGGSLASSLFLGVLAGFGLLWLQPLAMILGIIMLSAIGYVAMSIKERPFQAINRHINPVLGWGWAFASLAANMVWALPQYSLASGVLQNNLLPGTLGPDSALGDFYSKVVISASILLITVIVTFAYDSGGWGIKLYELFLKFVVAGIVACFVGVVCVMAFAGSLDWGAILRGFIPDFTKVYQPAEGFQWMLDMVGGASAAHRDFWVNTIIAQQRDVMISAAATAVGINMTFLLPYSMLRRGWDKDFRGLAIFDLSTGMFIPFVLATSCVVIASATQFHPVEGEAVIVGKLDETTLLTTLPDDTIKRLETQKLEAAKKNLGTEKFGKLTEQQRSTQSHLTKLEIETACKLIVVKHRTTSTMLQKMSKEDSSKVLGKLQWSEIAAAKAMMRKRLEAKLGEGFAKLKPEQVEAQLEPLSQSDLILVAHLQAKAAWKIVTTAPVDQLKAELGAEKFAKLSKEDAKAQAAPLTPIEALLAVHLQKKNAFALAKSLKPLTGNVVANYVFGIGVLGMTLSTITLLMLISGFVICEMLGLPPKGWANRLGTLAATTGVLGPFIWSSSAFWLAVPTSVFGMILLPIAYVTFFWMMNSKALLGDQRPRGLHRVLWNALMIPATLAAVGASLYMVWVKSHYYGMAGVAAFLLLVIVVHFTRSKPTSDNG